MADKRRPAPRLGDIRPPSGRELAQSAAEEWENSIVSQICVQLKISTDLRRRMRDWNEERGEGDRLDFEALHHVLPELPVQLFCKIFPNLGKRLTVSRFFTAFASTEVYKYYQQLVKDQGLERHCVGLVFRWPRLGGPGAGPTGLVLHNRPPQWDVPGVRLTWTNKEGETLVVEPLPVLLAAILGGSSEWRP